MAAMSATEFLQTLAQNPELRQQLGLSQGEANLSQFVAGARAAGYDFSEQDILDVIQAQPMSDEQLDQVSGGQGSYNSITPVGGINFNPASSLIIFK